MDHIITTTPQDIVNTFLAICGAIITISAAFTVIWKVVMKAKEPDRRQNERIDRLEQDVQEIEERLKLGKKRFETDANRVDNLEESMKESNRVIIESLLALTAHALDGNNDQELKAAKKQLTEHLLKR